MYVYMILKLDIRFFNVFILDVSFYFCFLFLYTWYCMYTNSLRSTWATWKNTTPSPPAPPRRGPITALTD